MIRRGHADVMIVGGTGSRINVSELMWHRGARLACNGKLPPAAVCRPFDAGRSGQVNGEGAAQIVIETREHAERRGARIMARVAGAATRFEPAADGKEPTGNAIARAIRAARSAADVKPDEIGHVNAHGNSTREDDPIEARAIRETLGDVPVTAPKSYFGNLGAGSGLIEMISSVLAMKNRRLFKVLNYDTPDPSCPLAICRTETDPGGSFLNVNVSPQGQASAVMVRRVA